jgi:hypothetical protein
MHDLPGVPALLALAREMLNELAPLLPEELHADARLLADAIAIAERLAEAGDGETLGILREVEVLYEPLTPALSPHCAEREGPPQREVEGSGVELSSVALLRRFANDLRVGAFEHSPLDGAARAILWRMTIAGLRRSNPNYLAANGLD